MKTVKIILAIIALSGLQLHTVSAENTGENNNIFDSSESICVECAFLSPSIPMQATYEDQAEVRTLMIQNFLKPQPPVEADFSEVSFSPDATPEILKPQVPSEANFSSSL